MNILEDDAVTAQASTREDCPSPAQISEGVPENPELEHGDHRRAQESEDQKRHEGSLEAQHQTADTPRRREQSAEMDKVYEKLEDFSHEFHALRQEAKPGDPEQSTPLPLDGMVLRRFILSSDFDRHERGTNRLGAILSIGIAFVVVVTIAYYFAIGKGQLSNLGPTALEHPAEPAASAQISSALPLTRALGSPSAPVQAQPTPTRAMTIPDEIQLLLKQGQELMAVGDLATARIVLRRAAEAGAVAAAFALARCYDPKVLTQMRARGVAPDISEARRWYEIARQMGSAEAARQLEFLPPE